MKWCALGLLCLFFTPVGHAAQAAQASASPQTQASYPNTSDGLQNLIADILQAAKAKDSSKEAALIHSLLIPENSTWLTEAYGPGFGSRLATSYERLRPSMEQEITEIYEADARQGWTRPQILRYTDPESVNSPIDSYLNCMDKIVPLYATAFRGGSSASIGVVVKAGAKQTYAAGDLPGFYIYDQSGFRFLPQQILHLPSQRPVRIALGMDIMASKAIAQVPVHIPPQLIQHLIERRTSVQTTIELVIDVDGNVKESKVASGDPVLGSAVLDAFKQWRFSPTKLDGDPVEVELQIPYDFEFH